MATRTIPLVGAGALAFLLPLLLASARPAAARDAQPLPDWFYAAMRGDELGARSTSDYIDRHPAKAFALLMDCLRKMPREAARCVRWLPSSVRTPAQAVEAMGDLLEAPPASRWSRDRDLEIQVILAAGRIGPDASPLVPRIAAYLASLRESEPPDPHVVYVAGSLGQIEPEHPAVVPAFEEVLFSSTGKQGRTTAVRALGRLGSGGRAAVAPLQRALDDPEPEIRETTLRALAKSDPGQVGGVALRRIDGLSPARCDSE